MEDLTDLFREILAEHRTLDFADHAFKKMIAEDAELRALYREWCEDEGTTERYGFSDYCRQLLEEEQEAFDSLNEYSDDI